MSRGIGVDAARIFQLKIPARRIRPEGEGSKKELHSPRTLAASVSRSNSEPSARLGVKLQFLITLQKCYCPRSHLPAV